MKLQELNEAGGISITKGDTYAVRPQGKHGFVIIDRKSHSMVHTTFDDKAKAEKYTTDNGGKIDNSSMDN